MADRIPAYDICAAPARRARIMAYLLFADVPGVFTDQQITALQQPAAYGVAPTWREAQALLPGVAYQLTGTAAWTIDVVPEPITVAGVRFRYEPLGAGDDWLHLGYELFYQPRAITPALNVLRVFFTLTGTRKPQG